MGYKGNTIKIHLDGGLNTNYNVENVPPNSFTVAKNINIHNGGPEVRGGTSKYNTTVITDNPRVMGGFQYWVGSTNEIIAYTARGGSNKDIMYTVGGSGVAKTLYTATNAITKVPSFVLYAYKCYMANGYDTVQVHTGAATTSALAAPHADWGTNDQPIQLIKHGAVNSERLWAVGTTGTPGFIYYSQDNDGSSEASFTAAGSGRIYIDTGDKWGLVGGIEYQDRLLIFGKKQAYIVDDIDTDTANWGYVQVGWQGGAASHRLIVATPSDVFAMTDDGEIYSVTAAQNYGDYKSASITRPAWIHTWIKDNVDMTYVSDFHAVYDYEMKAIKWFVVRTANTSHAVDTALVYYVNRPPETAWVIHDNQTTNINGYNASCSFHIKESTNKLAVYTGDWGGTSKGILWKTEQSAYSDNDTAFDARFKTARLAIGGQDGFSDSRRNKKFKELRIIDQNLLNATSFGVNVYIDGVLHEISYSFTEPAHGFTLGTSVLNVGVLTDDKSEYKEYIAEIGDSGKRIQIEVSNNNTPNVYFYIASMILDFKQQTARP
jgi:hypothetical protein